MPQVVRAGLKNRRDSLENWEKRNPVLLAGEIGIVLGTNPVKFKIGDGSTPWSELKYAVDESEKFQYFYTKEEIQDLFKEFIQVMTQEEYDRLERKERKFYAIIE